MPMSENELHLALLQLQELAALYGKDSAVVRAAQNFHLKRRACKKAVRLFVRRLFKKPAAKPQDRLKLLVHVRGGIGDVAMTRVFVARLREKFPTAQIYICYDSQSVVEMIFSDGLADGFASRKYDPRDYDLVMSGCHAFYFDYVDLPRLQRLAPQWMSDFEQARALQERMKIITQNTPHLDGLWAKISVAYGSSRIANMGLTAGVPVGQNDRAPIPLSPEKMQSVLQHLGLQGKKYITIHDGTNTNTDLHGRPATRCWPREHWQEFARLFKQAFPDIWLVQLGGRNSTVFDFADVSLVGKTRVADLPYVLQGARLHVDGESGMTQLANLTDTQAVVLFGPTPVEYFGYARNVNLRAGDCHNCMNIVKDWMSRCPLFERNECLWKITPQQVCEAVKKCLQTQK